MKQGPTTKTIIGCAFGPNVYAFYGYICVACIFAKLCACMWIWVGKLGRFRPTAKA